MMATGRWRDGWTIKISRGGVCYRASGECRHCGATALAPSMILDAVDLHDEPAIAYARRAVADIVAEAEAGLWWRCECPPTTDAEKIADEDHIRHENPSPEWGEWKEKGRPT